MKILSNEETTYKYRNQDYAKSLWDEKKEVQSKRLCRVKGVLWVREIDNKFVVDFIKSKLFLIPQRTITDLSRNKLIIFFLKSHTNVPQSRLT